MTYRVDAARSRVKSELKRIPRNELLRIGKAVSALAEDPYPTGAIQLERSVFRIRVGDYCVIYKVYEDERLVLIGRVVRRSESTYRGVGSLFS